MGAWGIGHWLVVLAIVALVFGTKKLRNVGEDVGAAIKSFKKGMQDGDDKVQLKADPPAESASSTTSKTERVD